jgi:hypothetical protein
LPTATQQCSPRSLSQQPRLPTIKVGEAAVMGEQHRVEAAREAARHHELTPSRRPTISPAEIAETPSAIPAPSANATVRKARVMAA